MKQALLSPAPMIVWATRAGRESQQMVDWRIRDPLGDAAAKGGARALGRTLTGRGGAGRRVGRRKRRPSAVGPGSWIVPPVSAVCTAAKAWQIAQSVSFGVPAGASESGDVGLGARHRAASPNVVLPDVALSQRAAIASPAQFGASA
ncbi:hypothetical protein [Azospirillum cavernae]|nr:hypothetical protein [Azospirillum cavernae]